MKNSTLEQPKTNVYFASYDIKCKENCQADCPDRMVQFRCNLGIKISKEKFIGKGSQGSVYSCTWHGLILVQNIRLLIKIKIYFTYNFVYIIEP